MDNNKKNSRASGRRLAAEPAEKFRREESAATREKVKTEAAVSARRERTSPVSEPQGVARWSLRRIKCRWSRIVREKRAHRFPESNRALIQLLLFGWSMVPMLFSLLEERFWGRRKQKIHRSGRVLRIFGGSKPHPVLFLMGSCALAAALMFATLYTEGTVVTYDGEVMAVLSSEEEAENVRTALERVTTRTLGETFTIDDSLLQYSTGWMLRTEIEDTASFEEELSEEIGLVTEGYSLYINGELIGSTPYEGALEELLNQLQEAVMDENTISCSFAEDVEIRKEHVPTEDLMNLGYIAEILYSTKSAEVTYEIKKGDTWLQIAADHGISSKDLLALNPGYDINKLQIGEVLTMSASVPYLTMTVVKQERYLDSIPFEIEYTPTEDLYVGDYDVISAGEYGAADVVADVTYVNGVETQRTILSSVTLTDPVTEHRLEGTKQRPTWHPTGTFRWPTTGRISSYFGGRRSPGGIGSTNHKGIDIAAPKGTPVYAADGGTVTYAGWMSGYGYTVRIRHDGTGYETYYAHNSSLTVRVGDHVHKGQQIARVGSTGNSTGNHCHFEIRYNGVAKNPLNYLP